MAAGDPIIDAVDGAPFLGPDGDPIIVAADGTECCCVPTVCFGTPCLNLTVSPIAVCDNVPCQTVPGFPGGTFKLPLFASDADSCIWGACFSGVGAGITVPDPCDGSGITIHGCDQFTIGVEWQRDPVPPLKHFVVSVFGGNNCLGKPHWLYFLQSFDTPLSDGLVVTQPDGDPACDNAVYNHGGTVTIHLPVGGVCADGDADPITCLDCNCDSFAGCPDCIDAEPESGCSDPLPDTVTFDLSHLTLCDDSGDCVSCTLGSITLTLLSGTCAGAPSAGPIYTGILNDADGNPCITGVLTWNGVAWYVRLQDVRFCRLGSPVLWQGFHVTGSAGPGGDYRIQCFGACSAANGNVCTITAGAPVCKNIEDFPSNPGDCTPATQPGTLHFAVDGGLSIQTCDGITAEITAWTMATGGVSCASGANPSYSFTNTNFTMTYSYDSSVGQWALGINDTSGLAWEGINVTTNSVTGVITLICGQCCTVNCGVITITVS